MGRGPELVNRWRAANGVTVATLAASIGDDGQQIGKWLSGHREKIPLRLVVGLAEVTAIPVWDIATPEQGALMRQVVSVVAMAAVWPGEAA